MSNISYSKDFNGFGKEKSDVIEKVIEDNDIKLELFDNNEIIRSIQHTSIKIHQNNQIKPSKKYYDSIILIDELIRTLEND